jgi:hypothetical protein
LALLFFVLPKHTQDFFDGFVFRWTFRIGVYEQGMPAHSREFFLGFASKTLSSGQQCLQVIRGWASIPRFVFFGPAVPPSYSRLGFDPSICLLRVSSAFELFEVGLRSLELSSSGQQCLQSIRI